MEEKNELVSNAKHLSYLNKFLLKLDIYIYENYLN